MESKSSEFLARSSEAMRDEHLQSVLNKLRAGLEYKRKAAILKIPNFEELKEHARAVKDHTLANLDHYLEEFESSVIESGGHVHWARTSADLNRIALEICQKAGALRVTKSKSMIAEETGLNTVLEEAGIEVTETDLGEYIIQLAEEPPSHIIGPAIHKTKQQVIDLFKNHHDLGERELESVKSIVDEARKVLRDKFCNADVGITGANFLVAETGRIGLVTNEGNGDLTATLPRVHIAVASIEKVVPTPEDASALLRVLVPSATGQPITSYVSFFGGPRKQGDPDGPEEFHVILLDNNRTDMLAGEFRDMLRCIRCATCLNHCPVYTSVGGHAYGWVYPGPMGSVLTPLMTGMGKAHLLPNACSSCGRCEEVCPMGVPLPDMLRQLRTIEREQGLTPAGWRWGLTAFMKLLQHPRIYHLGARWTTAALKRMGKKRGSIASIPVGSGWTKVRELPSPEGRTFQDLWRQKNRKGASGNE